jgi:hypothetical protein
VEYIHRTKYPLTTNITFSYATEEKHINNNVIPLSWYIFHTFRKYAINAATESVSH